ncbi:hypothetical protein BRADI_4g43314v3 [Brachypodium distachyon]|uniref:Uncharacterized protein n=1 Tax=Brachypodium distachyon TaxID=15368 RepID=A0A0Q3HFX4_BRADI|nr:hypothetical protein BRADI_4g43314v3 [Brachypodium distachyon]KQJ92387.1 hypothetical protein BRADI_4g43314v3 [Brachypodium distachyon]
MKSKSRSENFGVAQFLPVIMYLPDLVRRQKIDFAVEHEQHFGVHLPLPSKLYWSDHLKLIVWYIWGPCRKDSVVVAKNDGVNQQCCYLVPLCVLFHFKIHLRNLKEPVFIALLRELISC